MSVHLTAAADRLIRTARRALQPRDYGRLLLILVDWGEGAIGKSHAEYELLVHVERVDATLAREFRLYLDYADRMDTARRCRNPATWQQARPHVHRHMFKSARR